HSRSQATLDTSLEVRWSGSLNRRPHLSRVQRGLKDIGVHPLGSGMRRQVIGGQIPVTSPSVRDDAQNRLTIVTKPLVDVVRVCSSHQIDDLVCSPVGYGANLRLVLSRQLFRSHLPQPPPARRFLG